MQVEPELIRRFETSGREFIHLFLSLEKDLLRACTNMQQRQQLAMLKQIAFQWESYMGLANLLKPKVEPTVVMYEQAVTTEPDITLPATPNSQ